VPGRQAVHGSAGGLGDHAMKEFVLSKSYVGESILTLVMYFLLYLPGLIINLVYLNEVDRVRKATGETPSGYGCLLFLRIFLGLIPAVIFIIGLIQGFDFLSEVLGFFM
jgi:hypothetical protein